MKTHKRRPCRLKFHRGKTCLSCPRRVESDELLLRLVLALEDVSTTLKCALMVQEQGTRAALELVDLAKVRRR